MRIGLVIYGSLDTQSGGYLYDRKLVAYLRSQGDTVDIISQPWQSYAAHLSHNLEQRWLKAQLAVQADVILQDELNHPSLFWSNRRLAGQCNCPVVSIVHHLRSSEVHPLAIRWLYRQVERAYLRTITSFIFNSQTTQISVDLLLGGNASGVVATPAGDRFGRVIDEAAIRRRCQQRSPLRMVFIGNVIRRKGLHTLLQALMLLREVDWTLSIIGRDDVEPGYTALVCQKIREYGLGERVCFLGSLETHPLAEQLANSDLMVMVSSYEGFGIVYLEGMAFGLPAIASRAGGAVEIIEDGQNGYLVQPETPGVLAEKLSIYGKDRKLLLEHSLAARRRFVQFPTWEQTTQKIRNYLVSLKESER